MPLKLNSSGGGSVTVQEPSTASNVTFNLPSETATAIYSNASGNVGIGTSSPSNKLQVSSGGADVARFTNTLSNGGDWQFKIGGGGFEDRRLMITDRFSGADDVRVGVDSSGNFQFNSGYGSAAVAYGCRAWVNFNGTGTVAIRASGNVSSITDNNTGLFTVNYTNAMPDVNYAVSINQQPTGDPGTVIAHIGPTGLSPATYSTTATTIRTAWNNAAQDPPIVTFAVFR
jgi:hypothetical protein